MDHQLSPYENNNYFNFKIRKVLTQKPNNTQYVSGIKILIMEILTNYTLYFYILYVLKESERLLINNNNSTFICVDILKDIHMRKKGYQELIVLFYRWLDPFLIR